MILFPSPILFALCERRPASMWSHSPGSIDHLHDQAICDIFSQLDPYTVAMVAKRVSFRWLHLARRTLTKDSSFATIKLVAEAEPKTLDDDRPGRKLPASVWWFTAPESKLAADQYAQPLRKPYNSADNTSAHKVHFAPSPPFPLIFLFAALVLFLAAVSCRSAPSKFPTSSS